MLHSPSQILNPFAPRTFGYGTGPSGGGSSTPTEPAAPGNFQAVAGNQVVNLSWNASAGADDYALYVNATDSFGTATLLASGITDLSVVDNSGQAGERRYYWIVASNEVGDSDPSTSAYARPYVTLANGALANLPTPSGTWILSTLFFGSMGNLPSNCNVAWDGGLQIGISLGDGIWEDGINGGLFDASISGAFEFTNSSGVSVTFWDTEP